MNLIRKNRTSSRWRALETLEVQGAEASYSTLTLVHFVRISGLRDWGLVDLGCGFSAVQLRVRTVY